jgi:hypothetical protein
MHYLLHISEINNGTIFHIVKKKFKVLPVLAIPFVSKEPAAVHVELAPVLGNATTNPD